VTTISRVLGRTVTPQDVAPLVMEAFDLEFTAAEAVA
jgi:lipoyl(octanoyl) transferase